MTHNLAANDYAINGTDNNEPDVMGESLSYHLHGYEGYEALLT